MSRPQGFLGGCFGKLNLVEPLNLVELLSTGSWHDN
jgi:hypothetical protein